MFDLILIILTFVTIVTVYFCVYNIKHHARSITIAKLLLETDELLTENIRNYIITGNNKYIKNYWEIALSRQSSYPWSESFQREHGFILDINETTTIEELWKQTRLSSKEIEIFREAFILSSKLMWKEIQSINWVSGNFDGEEEMNGNNNSNGQAKKNFDSSKEKQFYAFNTKGEPDAQRALDNLYSKEYIEDSEYIKALCLKGTLAVYERTQRLKNISQVILYTILVFFLIFNFLYVFKISINK